MLITTTGDYPLEYDLSDFTSGSSSSIIVKASRVYGTATVTLTYKDELDNFIPLVDGIIAVNTQHKVECGRGEQIYATVANTDGTTNIAITAKNSD